jgi:hypothetical protein
VRLLTRIPSLSSSPRIRSAPQSGLLADISLISEARGVDGMLAAVRARASARRPVRENEGARSFSFVGASSK